MNTTSAASILATQRSKKKYKSKKKVSQAASELGRAGGLVGGKARAAVLTDEQRSNIAYHAAMVRWGNRNTYPGKDA